MTTLRFALAYALAVGPWFLALWLIGCPVGQ